MRGKQRERVALAIGARRSCRTHHIPRSLSRMCWLLCIGVAACSADLAQDMSAQTADAGLDDEHSMRVERAASAPRDAGSDAARDEDASDAKGRAKSATVQRGAGPDAGAGSAARADSADSADSADNEDQAQDKPQGAEPDDGDPASEGAPPSSPSTTGAAQSAEQSESEQAAMADEEPTAEPSGDGMSSDEADEPTPEREEPVTSGSLRWLGRVDERDPEAVRFSWAGSGFAAQVKGSSISVRLISEDDSIYYMFVLDGEPGERFVVETGEHAITLATDLSDEVHELELYRDTEGDGATSVFLGFEQGAVVGAPEATGRFFEVVGDSISVGFGSMGMERHGDDPGPECGADHWNSSWFQTYEAIAARALDAEVSTLARSGFGVVRGYGQNMSVMPPLFDDTLAGEDDPIWGFKRQPAAVVINLGTNDWNGGDPGTPYETAYIAFVEEIRARYPDTWILMTIGPTLDPWPRDEVVERLQNVKSARERAGDEKIDIFDLGIQDTKVTGCSWHPSAAEHMRMGAILTEELRTRLDWW